MAKVEGTDTSFYMNPAAYTQVKEEKKSKTSQTGKSTFSTLFDNLRGKTADQIGPLKNLPFSDDSLNILMDEVRNAGDVLKSRPYPDEILLYKQSVRNFINYVVQNAYSVEHDEGIPNFLKPGFKGSRGGPEAMDRKIHTKIQVIDKKLEDLAALLLSGQRQQLQLVSRLEEIRGLLVDLLQ